ncbi:MAG: hypothetical protein E6Q97_00955 [Desulfurellales bacterium]|nr:MAG: hypothetical protein E6Q97_00955 [Desulfurellales bacterium]
MSEPILLTIILIKEKNMSEPILLTIPPAGVVNLIDLIDHRQGVINIGNATATPVVLQLDKTSEEHNQWMLSVVTPAASAE